MALVKPNFDEVVVIENGEYSTRIVDAEVKQSKAGNTYINWALEIYGETAGRAKGAKVRYMTMTTGKGAGKLQSLHVAATGQPCPAAGFDTDLLLGKSVRAFVTDEKDVNGQLTGFKEVRSVLPLA